MSSIGERYTALLGRILAAWGAAGPARAQRAPSLLAVSKGQSFDQIAELYGLGHRDFGENYAQELIEKAREARERGLGEIRWHFIGHLQTNKAKMVVPWIRSIHSVDSLKLAQKLAQAVSERGGAPLDVYIEVNVDGQPSKAGIDPEATVPLALEIAKLPELKLQGLMAIPDPSAGEAGLKKAFARLRELERRCQPQSAGGLSMGMSGDFPWAVAEGSTWVRVGTALFGPRK